MRCHVITATLQEMSARSRECGGTWRHHNSHGKVSGRCVQSTQTYIDSNLIYIQIIHDTCRPFSQTNVLLSYMHNLSMNAFKDFIFLIKSYLYIIILIQRLCPPTTTPAGYTVYLPFPGSLLGGVSCIIQVGYLGMAVHRDARWGKHIDQHLQKLDQVRL